ncbi:MAG: NAD(P)-dependent alcohol dehydrogenase [Rhodobacteraceae bacterium]|nr:NAD(P)-dependent alcohol dehydrogenase [Paracoccaceae bacterium]
MKASVHTRFGSPDVLQLRDVPTPRPGPNDVLVKVHTSTVTRTDACALRAHPWFMRPMFGLFRPRHPILGFDFSGVVEAVGPQVTGFAPGQRVFGLAPDGAGAHAEYLCLPSGAMIAPMPEGLDFAQAVLCEGAFYANTYLGTFAPQPGQTILIYGGSGAIGTAAVQLANARGATVTAVVGTKHLELAESLGADRVIDYTAEDFTAIPERFDFVLDAVGKTTFFHCRHLLKPGGTYSATDLGPWYQNLWLPLWYRRGGKQRVIMPMPVESAEAMEFIRARVAADELRAVIDRHYPLRQIAEAYRYVDTAQKTGIVVVDIAPVG